MTRHLVFLSALLLGACGNPKQTLNIFTFTDYIDPAIVAEFEKQFDCKVILDFMDTGDVLLSKLSAGGTSPYDIIDTSSDTIPIFKGLGLLAPLRRESIPNMKNLDPQFTNTFFDPGNAFSVPYHWGTVGLFVLKPRDEPVDETWGLIFDPAKQRGPFLLVDEMRTCIGPALRYKGYSVNSTNPKELAEARDLLIETKKRSLGFQVGAGGRDRVRSGAVTAVVTYSGDTPGVRQTDSDTYYFVPREGSLIFFDCLSIPAKAPHRDLAEKFINYFLDPKVSAQSATYLRLAMANKAALELLDPHDRTNQAIYPSPETMKRLEFIKDLGEQTKLYDEIWTQIKAK